MLSSFLFSLLSSLLSLMSIFFSSLLLLSLFSIVLSFSYTIGIWLLFVLFSILEEFLFIEEPVFLFFLKNIKFTIAPSPYKVTNNVTIKLILGIVANISTKIYNAIASKTIIVFNFPLLLVFIFIDLAISMHATYVDKNIVKI